jgi:hypothetical protein
MAEFLPSQVRVRRLYAVPLHYYPLVGWGVTPSPFTLATKTCAMTHLAHHVAPTPLAAARALGTGFRFLCASQVRRDALTLYTSRVFTPDLVAPAAAVVSGKPPCPPPLRVHYHSQMLRGRPLGIASNGGQR